MIATLKSGLAHAYGNDIDTDRIIPGKYTKTLNKADLAAHVLEDLDPTFRERVQPGDLMVGGWNFGCGSSREQAPLALAEAGIQAVIASSFARIFYRNAINIGLPVFEIGEHQIQTGSAIVFDLATGKITDRWSAKTYQATPMPPVMIEILNRGGLVPYLRYHGDYVL